MVTGDHAGYVKYWQSNMNNVRMFQAHKEPVRGIRYINYMFIFKIILPVKMLHDFTLTGWLYLSEIETKTNENLFIMIVIITNKIE